MYLNCIAFKIKCIYKCRESCITRIRYILLIPEEIIFLTEINAIYYVFPCFVIPIYTDKYNKVAFKLSTRFYLVVNGLNEFLGFIQ